MFPAKRPSQWEVQTLFLLFVNVIWKDLQGNVTGCVLRVPGNTRALLQLFNYLMSVSELIRGLQNKLGECYQVLLFL